MATIMVTGGTGFIGGHLVRELKNAGHQVRCLVRKTSNTHNLQSLGVELCEGSLSDRESLQRCMQDCSVIYHLAGQVYSSPKESFASVNARGTENLLDVASQQKKPPVIVATSSLAATGPRKRRLAPSEQDPMQPVSLYGYSKRDSEQVMRPYAKQLAMSIVRPPMVLGGGDTASLPLFSSVKKGIHTTIGKNTHFSVVYVKDLVDLLIHVADKGERLDCADQEDGKGIYFAGYKDSVSFEQLGNQIAVALGRKPPLVIRIPRRVLLLAGHVSDWFSRLTGSKLLLSKDKATEGVSGHWICNTEKAHNLGWQPRQSLQASLTETVEEYRRLNML